jgi:hypothetical protein
MRMVLESFGTRLSQQIQRGLQLPKKGEVALGDQDREKQPQMNGHGRAWTRMKEGIRPGRWGMKMALRPNRVLNTE